MNSTDLAIKLSAKSGTLFALSREDRFGDICWGLYDDYGVIEVFNSKEEMNDRLNELGVKLP